MEGYCALVGLSGEVWDGVVYAEGHWVSFWLGFWELVWDSVGVFVGSARDFKGEL